MSNHHNPGYVPNDYTPPVVSPTDSIAFSESGIMDVGTYDQFGVYQEAYQTQRGWYNPNMSTPYPNRESQLQMPSYTAPEHTVDTTVVPATGPYNPTGAHLAWTPSNVALLPPQGWPPSPQQSVVPQGQAQNQPIVAHHQRIQNSHQLTPPVLSPPGPPHHQIPQNPAVNDVSPHHAAPPQLLPNRYESRHNSIASTIVSSASTASISLDDQETYQYRPLSGGSTNPASPTSDNIRSPTYNIAHTDTLPSPTSMQPHGQSTNYEATHTSPSPPEASAASSLSTPAQLSQPAPPPGPPAKRKRGRPRIHPLDGTNSLDPRKPRASKRQPHNQVERKYREGLNAEMDRLRRAIPRLAQMPEGSGIGDSGLPVATAQKPSKSQVLQAAVQDLEELRLQNEMLEKERDRWKEAALKREAVVKEVEVGEIEP